MTRSPPASRGALFPALLKHWRQRSGLSQLDLSITADVSSRHISFLETGRASPSAEMVLRLATALSVPLQDINAMLHAAGHGPAYPEGGELPPAVSGALKLMKEQHPFPLFVMDRSYRVLDQNAGADRLIQALFPADAAPPANEFNLALMTFHPALQDVIVNFEHLGQAVLWRLQREVLTTPQDAGLRAVLNAALASPTVSDGWRNVDLAVPATSVLEIHLRMDALDLRFLTTLTVFQAPQVVSLEALRVETWFPVDEATSAACRAL